MLTKKTPNNSFSSESEPEENLEVPQPYRTAHKKKNRRGKKRVIRFLYYHGGREKVLDLLAGANKWRKVENSQKCDYVHFKREKGTNYNVGLDCLVSVMLNLDQ